MPAPAQTTPNAPGAKNPAPTISDPKRPILPILILALAILGAVIFLFINYRGQGPKKETPPAAHTREETVKLGISGSATVNRVSLDSAEVVARDIASQEELVLRLGENSKIRQKESQEEIGISAIKSGAVVIFSGFREAEDSNVILLEEITIPDVENYLPTVG